MVLVSYSHFQGKLCPEAPWRGCKGEGPSSSFTASWITCIGNLSISCFTPTPALGLGSQPGGQSPKLPRGGPLPRSPGISEDRVGPGQCVSVAGVSVLPGARTRVLALWPPNGPAHWPASQGGAGAACGWGKRQGQQPPWGAGSSRAKGSTALAKVGKQGREQHKVESWADD